MDVSVIIPTHNEETYIRRCLDVITNQSILPDEIIMMDYNSTDDTINIASEYTDQIYSIESPGIGLARAEAIKLTKNNIILSTDADTILDEHFIEIGLEDLSDPNISAVTGKIKAIDQSKKHYEPIVNLSKKGRGHNTMFKKQFCDVNYCYTNPGLGEDYELWDVMNRNGKTMYDPRLIVYTRLPTNRIKIAMKATPLVTPVLYAIARTVINHD